MSHTVQTTLNYYLPPCKGGQAVYYPSTASDKIRKHDPRDVSVTDIRGNETEFSLDVHGFQFVCQATAEKGFEDLEKIKSVYYPECEELVSKVTGASRVHAASHIVRARPYQEALEAERGLDDKDKIGPASAAHFIHVDQSYHGAETRLRDYLPFSDVQNLTRTRWAIMNVWRPFHHPVTRDNLAMADARSIPDSDLMAVQGILPAKDERTKGENYFATTGGDVIELWHLLPPQNGAEQHKWYFCSQMRPDEALLIKQFDSKRDGGRGGEDYGPPRRSLEVRCFVFWEDQERD